MAVEVRCKLCGAPFVVPPSVAKKRQYCSQKCAISDPDGARKNLDKPRVHRITNVDVVNRLADCAKCGPRVAVRQRSDNKKWRCHNGEVANRRARAYGLSEEDSDAILQKQNYSCAICKTKVPRGRHRTFHVDHDHQTGKVRGLLCNNCNIGIGALGDNYDTVLAAANYLSASQ